MDGLKTFLSGKKTYLVAALVAVVVGLNTAGVIDDKLTEQIMAGLATAGLITLRAGIAKSAPILLAFLAFGLSGCGGSVTIAECTARVDQAQILKLGCGEFKHDEAKAQCVGIADAAIAAARAGCQFAEPEAVASTQ